MFTSKLQSSGRSRINYSADNLSRSSIKGKLGDVSNLNLSKRANRDGLYLQQFGGTVPVLVTETLRFRRNVVGGFGPGHLVYIMSERQLIIWNWSEDTNRSKIPKCYTLQLPSSNHRFTTNCVLLQSTENSSASCIVVSREGFVRYWNNIANEASFSETTLDNRRHECVAVVPFQVRSDTCCILSQTGDIILLTIRKQGLDQWRVVKFSSGLLSGISRRVSSYLFSSQGQPSLGELRCACIGEFVDEAEFLYLIIGSTLQKCMFSDFEDASIFQCPVESLFAERLADEIWKQNTYHPSGIRVSLLDMKHTNNGLFVLGCGVNLDVDATVHYAIGILHAEGKNPPQSFLSFFVVPTKTAYSEVDKFGDVSMCKLLLDDKSNAFVYFKQSVICMSLANPTESSFSIDFLPTDQMIGFGFAHKFPAAFSSSHGLQRLQDSSSVAQSSFVDQSYQETNVSNVSLTQAKAYDVSAALASVTQDRLLEMTMSEDEFSQFKAAFISTTRNDLANAYALTDELFSGDARPRATESSLLDVLSARLSKEILDDIPSKDPRWAKMSSGSGGFSTASLILMHQLDDKARVHAIYVNFLKTLKLVSKLGVVALRGAHVPTGAFLGEQAEKLAAARMLVELQVQNARVVDAVVSRLVRARNSAEALSRGLTDQDVFYREVSRFDDVVAALLDVEQELRAHSQVIGDQVHIVQSVNAVLIGIVGAVNQYRQENVADTLPPSQLSGPSVECVPWFCPVDEQSGKFVLLQQHALTATCIAAEATNASEVDALYQQLVVITDVILEAYNTWLDWRFKQQSDGTLAEKTIQLKLEFESRKKQLLEPFMRGKRYEQAIALAEKYYEFDTLVEICRVTEDEDRLQKYMTKFQGRGFGEFVCKWYAERGMRGHLLGARFVSQPSLKKFLHAGENRFMSWLHDVDAGDYYGAHRALLDLATHEKQFLAKKKTLLSLSKLAALAATDHTLGDLEVTLNAVQREQELVLHQDQLPCAVVEALAMDRDNMHVLTVAELIECCISLDINPVADEHHFKKALELVSYIDHGKIDASERRLHIWSQAALRDDWLLVGSTDAISKCKGTVFFKLVALCDDKSLLPSVEELLLSDELTALKQVPTFEFLLRAGYEHLKRQQ